MFSYDYQLNSSQAFYFGSTATHAANDDGENADKKTPTREPNRNSLSNWNIFFFFLTKRNKHTMIFTSCTFDEFWKTFTDPWMETLVVAQERLKYGKFCPEIKPASNVTETLKEAPGARNPESNIGDGNLAEMQLDPEVTVWPGRTKRKTSKSPRFASTLGGSNIGAPFAGLPTLTNTSFLCFSLRKRASKTKQKKKKTKQKKPKETKPNKTKPQQDKKRAVPSTRNTRMQKKKDS